MRTFHKLQSRLREGSESAAGEVFARYARRLVELANHQQQGFLQGKYDGDDVVQSAFRSFFERFREGQFELTSWDSLWGLLVRITLRKCGRTATFWTASRRDARRDVSLESAIDGDPQVEPPLEPSPAEAVELYDLVERICADLTSTQRTIFLMELQGYSAADVASHVGRSLRTVRRTLAEIRAGLTRWAD